MTAEDSTLPVVAKLLGKLCHGLSKNLTDEKKLWFLDFYRQMCKVGLSDKARLKDQEANSPPKVPVLGMDIFEEEDKLTECRRHAAFNFPAMVLFAGAKSFKPELYSTFSALCNDPNNLVRKTVASGFHEVAKLLGGNVTLVQPDLIRLLKDDSSEVVKGVVSHLPETLDILGKCGGVTITETRMNSLVDIIPALMASEKVIFASNNWRLQEELMTNFSCLPSCFTSDAIFTKIIPIVYKKVQKSRALPVRHAAGRTLLTLIRNIKKEEQREECFTNIVNDFCHSESCYKRSLFIDLCKAVLEIYSRKFFKDHFYEAVLELTADPVPNIRLKLCSILPHLKKILKVPTDRVLLQQLEACVRKLLINEKDRDVNTYIKQAVEELDRIHVQMESIKKRMYFEDELADERKEEEEKRLLEIEEKERKEEEAKPKSEKKTKETSKKENCSSKIPSPRRGSTGKALPSTSREKLGSANLKKTPSAVPSATATTSSGRNTVPSGKSATLKPGTRATSTVPNASTANRKTSNLTVNNSVVARRGSMNSASSTGSDSSSVSQKSPSARKTSVGTSSASGPTTKKKTGVK